MRMVIASSLGFPLTLTANAVLAFSLLCEAKVLRSPHGIDQGDVDSRDMGF